jgi:hypothetical protein
MPLMSPVRLRTKLVAYGAVVIVTPEYDSADVAHV